jgi:Ca2+-binding RTX toxin-like protein
LKIGANFTSTGDVQIASIEKVEVTATGLAINVSNQIEAFAVTGFLGGATTFVGGSGNDTFTGGSGADSVDGGTGADSISAGAGNDTIIGAANDVVLDGGLDTSGDWWLA